MKFKAQLPDGQIITLDRNILTGKVRVFIRNDLLGTWSYFTRKAITLPLRNGGESELTLKLPWFDPAPRVFVDGTEVKYGRQFAKWEQAVVCTPLVLALGGGALPVMAAVALVYLNYWLIRNNEIDSNWRWVGVGVIGLTTVVLFASAVVMQVEYQKRVQAMNPQRKWSENDPDLPPLARPRWKD